MNRNEQLVCDFVTRRASADVMFRVNDLSLNFRKVSNNLKIKHENKSGIKMVKINLIC